MTQSYIIRLATPADAPLLPAVELAAASLYLTQLEVTGLTAETLAEPNSAEEFAMAQQADMLWVAVDADDNPIGFALLAEIDQWLHLDELDVLPEYGRRGIGTALVQHVCQLARDAGYPGVTLATFRDVAWNAPFYQHLGFQVVPPAEQTPGLQAVVASEKEGGLHTDLRVVMRFALT
jgi:GNAT superfamily N-acetyltransferase